MNFDKLQQEWKEENTENIQVPDNTNILEHIQTPIGELKKRVKIEFSLSVVSILFLLILPFLPLTKISGNYLLVYYIAIIMFAIHTAYYYFKLLKIYKKMDKLNTSSREALLHLYYDFNFVIEIGKLLTFTGIPYIIIMVILLLGKSRSELLIQSISHNNIFILFTVITVCLLILFLVFFSNFIYKNVYGTNIDKIKKILGELDED